MNPQREMSSAQPVPVVTFLSPLDLPDDAVAVIQAANPGAEVYFVPYEEPNELRNARRRRPVPPDLLASAPLLSADDWAIIERTNALVAIDLPDGLLDRARNLAFIQTLGAGVDHLDAEDIARHKVHLCNGSGFNAVPIAEFVMARILEVWKHLRVIDQYQRDRVWKKQFGQALAGNKMGIVGLGSIGRATAQLARPFGVVVVACRRSARPGDQDSGVDRLYPSDELDDMISDCDIVVIAAPATDETRLLFNAQRIAKMKPGAVLCNIARGDLVDESALITALTDGHLSAAILDVATQEPLPPDNLLWSAPNCYLSPHTAAAEGYSRRPLVQRTARNLARARAGEPLESMVI
jgi:phosphoglycerate dehydrogenase-like enzyme